MFDLKFYNHIKLFVIELMPLYNLDVNNIVKHDYVVSKRLVDFKYLKLDNLLTDKYMSKYVDKYISYFQKDWYGKNYCNNLNQYVRNNS